MVGKTKPCTLDPRGAKCAVCKQHMQVADGCMICLLLLKDGTRVEPRKYEGGWDPGTGRCADCGAKAGHYHHPGCEHLEGAKMFAPRIRPRKSKGGANGSLGVS